MILAYVLSFADPEERFATQALMVGSVTVIMVGGPILAWFLSHPYEDQVGSVKPVAMERTLDELTHDPEFAAPALSVPCDANGRNSSHTRDDDTHQEGAVIGG